MGDSDADNKLDETGGDAACWAHIFPDQSSDDGIVSNLVAVAASVTGRGAVWTRESLDLNVNLVVFRAGEGVEEHVNAEVDVLMIGVAGEGIVFMDGVPHSLPPGSAVLVPKGARRGTRAMGGRFAYLTCHRRRPGMLPMIGDGHR